MVKLDYIKLGQDSNEKHYQIIRRKTYDSFPAIDLVKGKSNEDLILQGVPSGTVEYQRVKKVLDRGVLFDECNGRRVTFEELCDKF